MSTAQELAVWFPAIRVGTGADVFTQRLCDGLNARGIRAEIQWLPRHAEYLPWAVAVPRPPKWASVVHVNSWLPQRFWPKDLPVVVTVHHLVHDLEFRPYRSLMQAAYHEILIRHRELIAIRKAVTVTTVSNYVRCTVSRFSGRTQVAVIHNWIDCDRFSPGTGCVPRNDGPFRLFMAGSRSKRKGVDLLPDFIKALGPGFEIRYAGGHAGGLPAIAGITDLGRISEDELIHEYRTCDAVVSLSRYEGFGYTALEAMACGKPFLGFETSALPEIVTTGCGMLVRVDDVLALAAAARKLRMESETGIVKWGGGRKRALEHFNQEKVDVYVARYTSSLLRSGPSQESFI